MAVICPKKGTYQGNIIHMFGMSILSSLDSLNLQDKLCAYFVGQTTINVSLMAKVSHDCECNFLNQSKNLNAAFNVHYFIFNV